MRSISGSSPSTRTTSGRPGSRVVPSRSRADGGATMLALFETGEGHPMAPQQTGVAFSVDANAFISFARALPSGIDNPGGDRLMVADLLEFDMCWAFDLVDRGETSTS